MDVNPHEAAERLVEHLAAELFAADPDPEVGYVDGQRIVLQAVAAPLPREELANAEPELGSDSVLLITGGARGITADIALELAERFQPTLILVGRSDLPPPQEDADTAGLEEAATLKAALIRRLQGGQTRVTPVEVERAYQRLLKEREIRSNMEALVQAGAHVVYHAVDVRDEAAFGELIDALYQSYGRIDGVVHGAGIIEDKLVKDKTVESWDRVVGTKLDSAFVLSRRLRPDGLRFLVLFSSVAGRFGNRGQADYAAANEVLNKLARHLDRHWPAHVVSINWGPWEKRGMVSPELLRSFAERGVTLVQPATGRRMLAEEIGAHRKGDAEIVIAGSFDDAPQAQQAPAPAASAPRAPMPLLEGRPVTWHGDEVEILYHLDPTRDWIIKDHHIEGVAVVPFAEGLELMAELAQQLFPHLHVARMRDIRVQRGIQFTGGEETIRLVARPAAPVAGDATSAVVEVEITDATPARRPHYRATVELDERLPAPPVYDARYAVPLGPFPETVEQTYVKYLFHGPALQGIKEVEGISEAGIVGVVEPSSPSELLAWRPRGEWIMDPVIMDSGFQLAFVWTVLLFNRGNLPSSVRMYHRYGPLVGDDIRCYMHLTVDPTRVFLRSTVYFVNGEGLVMSAFEGGESTCSYALRRLAPMYANQPKQEQ